MEDDFFDPPERLTQPSGCRMRHRLFGASLEQRREQVTGALSALGTRAATLSLVLAQPELAAEPEEFLLLGFADVKTSADVLQPELPAAIPTSSSATLVVCLGADVQPGIECCAVLDAAQNAPPIFAVLVYPDEKSVSEGGEQEPQGTWSKLLQAGADDVISLVGTQALTGRRVQEAIIRSEVVAQKASVLIEAETDTLKKKTVRVLETSSSRFLWDLPGTVLESIPMLDETLVESIDHDIGVGDYSITDQLGAGTFGAVFKATHPEHGDCALKVIPKNGVKGVGQLFMIDSEFRIMCNLAAHPNVVRAHEALHSRANIILVMEYAGSVTLHTYALNMVKSTGNPVMPKDLAERFCKQEAAAVAHLHAYMVCHRDLKPANFIVDDNEASIRLSDFSLSTVSLAQERLLNCCGSLPFVSPEVLRLQEDPECRAAGYDGLAADVWGLAANFVELACGLYSMERLLGWVEKRPTEPRQKRQEIERFADTWAAVRDIPIAGLHGLVARMLAVRPEDRWSMGQVVGAEGLALEEVYACPCHRQRLLVAPEDARTQAQAAR